MNEAETRAEHIDPALDELKKSLLPEPSAGNCRNSRWPTRRFNPR